MGVGARCLVPLRRAVSVVLGVAALWALAPAVADATTTCEYNGGAEVLNIRMAADNDSTILKLIGTTIDVRQASGLVSCSGGTPTTANTEAINVFDESSNGHTFVSIFTPQAFAVLDILLALPGANDGVSIASENVPASIIAGSSGVSVDGNTTKEINFVGTPGELDIFGGSASDDITARGGGATGGILNGPFVRIHGGAGNDELFGTELGDLLEGEEGNDTMKGVGGDDALIGDVLAASGDDVYDGGGGFDSVSYPLVKSGVTVDLAKSGPQETGNGNDSFSEIEGVIGSEFGDTLFGSAAANSIKAGQGDDTVEGRGGEDLLSGGSGTDTLTYADAPAGVTVDLGAGTASGGDGKDSLDLNGFENLIGSPFADSLTGSAAANQITGLAGSDTVQALAGPDRVDVRDGVADNASCGSEVDTAISDRRSLDTVQADCEIVDALPEPAQPGGGNAGGADGSGSNGGGKGGKGNPRAADDKVVFSLRAAKRQPLLAQGGVIVKLRCPQEACTVTVRGGRRLKPVTVRLAQATTKTVKLKIRKAKRPAIRRLLSSGGTLKLRLSATATDAAGNSAPARLTVTAQPLPLRHG